MEKGFLKYIQQIFNLAKQSVQVYPTLFLLAFLCLFCVVVFLSLKAFMHSMYALKRKIKTKRKQKIQEKRALSFALPDKENAFIKERLHQVLSDVDNLPEERKPQTAFEFLYARKLLWSLREKPLTVTERLELTETAAFFEASLRQTKWTVHDVRAVNDSFSRILKLCAKYAVDLPNHSSCKEKGGKESVN